MKMTRLLNPKPNNSFCPRDHSQHNHSARTKKSGVPSTFSNLLEARPIAAQGKKERTSSQISEEARPSAFEEIWKRRVKWGHSLYPNTLHATIYPASPRNFGRFSFEARYTVTRITLSWFTDTTSISASLSKDFWAGESASSPACQRSNPNRRLIARVRNTQIIPKPPRRCQFPRGGFRARSSAALFDRSLTSFQ